VDISKICLLDNSAASFAFYPDNAIPIESWKDDLKDSALLDILPFLDDFVHININKSFLRYLNNSFFEFNCV
jgi:TFIIF-interacting CTD phosphatase-like protein